MGVGIVLVYWLFVIVGAVGVDLLDGAGESAAGGVKGAAEGIAGALKGAGDAAAGAVKGGAEAAAGALKGAGEHATDALKAADGGLLAALGLVKVPVTVSMSLIAFWGWCACLALMAWVAPPLGFLPTLLVKSLIAIASVISGVLAASVSSRPLHSVFDTNEAPTRHAFMGKICTVTSGRVDAGFGTAALEDGGAGLNVHIFCSKDNALKKGSKALVLDYDAARDAYEVEPVDFLLPEELDAVTDPAQATKVAASRVKN